MKNLVIKIGCILIISFGLIVSVICAEQENWYEKGLFFNRTGQPDKAIEAFTKAIELNPESAKAYNNRGAVWYLKKDYDRAILDYSAAISREPATSAFYINRAAAWYKKREFSKTLSDYDRAIELDPISASAYNNRGMTRYNIGDYDRAILDHSKAIELNPEVSEYYNNRGAAWFRKGKLERAIVEYSRSLALNSKSFNALKNRGISWFKKGLYDRSIVDYNAALDVNHKSVDIYVARGIAYYQIKEYEKALNDFVDGVNVGPNNFEALNQLAWMLSVCPDEKYRNGEKAIKTAQKAVDLYPSLNTLDTLACATAETGEFEKAVTLQKRIISLAKDRQMKIPSEYLSKLESYEKNQAWRAEYVQDPDQYGKYPDKKMIQVSVGNIRAEPALNSFVIERVTAGTQIYVLGQDGLWYLTELADGQFGWAFESLFKEVKLTIASANKKNDNKKALPNSSTLLMTKEKQMIEVSVSVGRIRSASDAQADVLYKVVKGNRLAVIKQSEDWFYVLLGKNKTGWGHKSIFKQPPVSAAGLNNKKRNGLLQTEAKPSQPEINQEEMVEVGVNLGRIRELPQSDATILYRVVKGNRLQVLERKDDWFHVSLGKNKIGWGHKSLFRP